MKKFVTTSAVALIALFFAAPLLAVGQARIIGLVSDPEGNPVPEATITITNPERPSFEKVVKTGQDGRYLVMLLDGTYAYTYTVSKEGYVPQVYESFKAPIGKQTTFDWTIQSEEQAMAKAMEKIESEIPEGEKAKMAFNDGVAKLNAGELAAAEAKFLDAVAKAPDLKEAWSALGKLALDKKDKVKSLEYTQKALSLAEKEMAMLRAEGDEVEDSTLGRYLDSKARAQELNGDKKGALETRKRIAAAVGDASGPHNAAVAFFNGGKMAEAEGKLKEALGLNPDFADSHYLLSMILMGKGDNPGAKKHMQHYLKVAPEGPKAAEMKEFLTYFE